MALFENNKLWRRRMIYGGIFAAFCLFIYWALLPDPVAVDLQEIRKGEMEVTVDEEGVTRIREIYTVSAPVGGRILRSPTEVGDEIEKNSTVVATMEPSAPSFLDERSRKEAEAQAYAARAGAALAQTQLERAEAELEFAKSDLDRAEELAPKGAISERALEEARLALKTREAARKSALADLEVRRQELARALAGLIEPTNAESDSGGTCCIQIKSPESGKVLKIMVESEQVIASGTPLLEIGNPDDLEVVIELLSSDAVKVKEGAKAYIDRWGGNGVLTARVRRIEPAGFKKISALGVEEQRVNVLLDFTDDKEKWSRLGHDFRVFARIVTWRSDAVLRVPIAALFREKDEWAVFVFADGKAELRRIKIGERNQYTAQVVEGLKEGDQVVLHPSDRIRDGTNIAKRSDLE